jgi:hypothetical protein
MLEINWHPSRRDLRQFAGIWFPGFFALVGAYVGYKTGSLAWAAAIWTPAFAVSAVGYAVPAFMRFVYVGLTLATFPIGWVVSHMLMAVIFYVVITPVGLLLRLFRGDPLDQSFDRSAKSYWVPHNPASDAARYFKQF